MGGAMLSREVLRATSDVVRVRLVSILLGRFDCVVSLVFASAHYSPRQIERCEKVRHSEDDARVLGHGDGDRPVDAHREVDVRAVAGQDARRRREVVVTRPAGRIGVRDKRIPVIAPMQERKAVCKPTGELPFTGVMHESRDQLTETQNMARSKMVVSCRHWLG